LKIKNKASRNGAFFWFSAPSKHPVSKLGRI